MSEKLEEKKKKKKIYFAGSIRGQAVDKATLRLFISHLQQTYGTVLTEHVGQDVAEPVPLTDKEIFERDMNWLLSSDVVVAECSGASLGVGYELGRAQLANIPVLVLHCLPEGKLSAMISGCAHCHCERYDDPKEAISHIDSFFTQHLHWSPEA